MTIKNSQDIDLQKEGKLKFHRGSALTIFTSDRTEDLVALIFSMAIAFGVYLFVG